MSETTRKLLLCDHCRRMDCPTITTPAELDRRQLADMRRRGLELRDAF